jgi:septal ring factor EnvC (AmiA/AmiB activator)
MAESFWKSDAVDEAQVEEPASERIAEATGEASALRLSVDEFSALEERIVRTVNLVKRERQERAAAEERASAAEEKLREQEPLAEKLEKEVKALHDERDHVRQRVERLLAQLDALEL